MDGEFCVCSELAGSSLKASHWTSNAKACLIAWNINEFSFSGLKKSNINQITIDALERAKKATNTVSLRFFNNSFQRGGPRDRNDLETTQIFYLSILDRMCLRVPHIRLGQEVAPNDESRIFSKDASESLLGQSRGNYRQWSIIWFTMWVSSFNVCPFNEDPFIFYEFCVSYFTIFFHQKNVRTQNCGCNC